MKTTCTLMVRLNVCHCSLFLTCAEPLPEQRVSLPVLCRELAPPKPGNVQIDPTLISHLRSALNNENATWYSREQAEALQHIIHTKDRHTLTILRTGGGKTLLYVIPALYARRQGVYVVAVPNRGLLEDLKRRMQEYRLRSVEWKPGNREAFDICPIIFISSDMLHHKQFLALMQELKARGSLRAIMLDEVHKWVYEKHFRPSLQDPSCLARLGVPLHGLTATLKQDQVHKVENVLGLPRNTFVVTRGSTDRPNIEYKVIRAAPVHGALAQGAIDRVLLEVRALTEHMGLGELGLIISRSVEITRLIADALGCRQFFKASPTDSFDPQKQFIEWQAARNSTSPPTTADRWLSSTTLIDTGNDTRGVRYTVFCEPPFDMISLQQGSGRTAREGQRGTVIVVYDQYQVGGIPKDMDWEFADVGGVEGYVKNTTVCRRFFITCRWDVEGVSCAIVPGAIFCDICEAKKQGVELYFPPSPVPVLRTVEITETIALQDADKKDISFALLHEIQKHLIPQGMCPLHFAANGELVVHPAQMCKLEKTFGEGLLSDGFRRFQTSIKWQYGYVCWFCFFPQPPKDPRFHKVGANYGWCSHNDIPLRLQHHPDKNTVARHSKEFMNGLLWAIFHLGHLRARVDACDHLPPIPNDISAFFGYVTDITSSDMTTGHALIAECLKHSLEKLSDK
jgi:hypothetical protein